MPPLLLLPPQAARLTAPTPAAAAPINLRRVSSLRPSSDTVSPPVPSAELRWQNFMREKRMRSTSPSRIGVHTSRKKAIGATTRGLGNRRSTGGARPAKALCSREVAPGVKAGETRHRLALAGALQSRPSARRTMGQYAGRPSELERSVKSRLRRPMIEAARRRLAAVTSTL